MIVDLILLKNRNFCAQSQHFKKSQKRDKILIFYTRLIYKFPLLSYFFRIFGVTKVSEVSKLLQIVLFLTDSVVRVLFAYFDESMASKIVYKP